MTKVEALQLKIYKSKLPNPYYLHFQLNSFLRKLDVKSAGFAPYIRNNNEKEK